MANGSAKRVTQPPAAHAAAPARPAEAADDFPPPQPLKPRPVLLAAMSVVFAGWVIFLAALYFKTEYPRRSTAPRPDAKGVLPPEAATQPAR